MKSIKITASNSAAIEAALKAINGKAEKHAYTTYSELADLAHDAETALDAILYKKDWQGAQWTETSGAKTANSYKYMRDATRVTIERRSSDWFLIEARQVSIGSNGGGRGHLSLTKEQHEAATKRLSERYTVRSA